MQRLIGIPAILLFGAACGEEPSEEDYDDVATSVGALVSDNSGGEAEAAEDAVVAASGAMPAGFTKSGAGTLTGRRGTVDYSFELDCRDAQGAQQIACDDATDSAHLVLHWTGDVDTARWDASIVRDGDWTLTAIQSGTAVLDGTGSFDVDSSFMALYRPVSSSLILAYDARYEGVQIRTSDRVILGGKAYYNIDAERSSERRGETKNGSFHIAAEVTFTGNGTADILLDDARRYTVDFENGTVERVN
jgi:hypothetical protein